MILADVSKVYQNVAKLLTGSSWSVYNVAE